MSKSTALFIMGAIYAAPHVHQVVALILSACFVFLAFIDMLFKSKESKHD